MYASWTKPQCANSGAGSTTLTQNYLNSKLNSAPTQALTKPAELQAGAATPHLSSAQTHQRKHLPPLLSLSLSFSFARSLSLTHWLARSLRPAGQAGGKRQRQESQPQCTNSAVGSSTQSRWGCSLAQHTTTDRLAAAPASAAAAATGLVSVRSRGLVSRRAAAPVSAAAAAQQRFSSKV